MLKYLLVLVAAGALSLAAACAESDSDAVRGPAAGATESAASPGEPAGAGRIVRLDPRLDQLVPPGARIEKIADGFVFLEGPVWDARGSRLFFSDIPGNTIYAWRAADGVRPFVVGWYDGSGQPRRSWGPNGLTLDREGRLVVSDQGRRQITRIESDGTYTALADRFEGARLNSPNDVVYGSDGTLYFSDPPFGLDGQDESPLKELDFNGVYRQVPGGPLEVLVRDLRRPNGIALSPDETTLYVANSDAANAVWIAYDLGGAGVTNARVFFDATGREGTGLPDGLKVDREGNLFAAGPGGVWVFAPDGIHLGTIVVDEVPANMAWGDDGQTLYMTARQGLYRIRLATGGRIP